MYTPPLKDMQFVLNELVDVDSIAKHPGFEDATSDLIETILVEAGKVASDVFAPLNKTGDEQGSHLKDGKVVVPDGFTEAFKLLTELDNGITHKELEALGDEYLSATFRVIMKFETVGLLVFKGVVPIDAMEDLVGGAALNIWGVIEDWTKEMRKIRSQENFLEWYQWLAERLKERGESDRPPAFIEHANWVEPKRF